MMRRSSVRPVSSVDDGLISFKPIYSVWRAGAGSCSGQIGPVHLSKLPLGLRAERPWEAVAKRKGSETESSADAACREIAGLNGPETANPFCLRGGTVHKRKKGSHGLRLDHAPLGESSTETPASDPLYESPTIRTESSENSGRVADRLHTMGISFCEFQRRVILRPSAMPHELHADVDFVRDTSAEALSVFYEIQRKRPIGQKLVDVSDLSEGLFETVKAGIRLRYPEADEREVFLRAVASRVSRELMIRAYGWDPAVHE